MRNGAYGTVAELDIMDPRELREQVTFEHAEIARYEAMLGDRLRFPGSAYHRLPDVRRRWWRRRWDSIELLGLLAPDEGVVNQDALT